MIINTTTLIFKAKSASLHSGFIKEFSFTPSISYDVVYDQKIKLISADGTDLSSLQWNIEIYAKDQYNEKAEQLGGIGFMASSFHGDSYFISVAVGATTFSHLLKCDRLPDKIIITICGLGYESGSSIFLKNLDESVLVTEVAFSVPLFDKSAPTEDVSRNGDLQSWQRIIIMSLGVISVAVVTIAFKLLSS